MISIAWNADVKVLSLGADSVITWENAIAFLSVCWRVRFSVEQYNFLAGAYRSRQHGLFLGRVQDYPKADGTKPQQLVLYQDARHVRSQ